MAINVSILHTTFSKMMIQNWTTFDQWLGFIQTRARNIFPATGFSQIKSRTNPTVLDTNCPHCKPLNKFMRLDNQFKLPSLLRFIQKHAHKSTIIEYCPLDQKASLAFEDAFAQVNLDKPYIGIITHFFKCAYCAQDYEMMIDTGHNRHSYWKPIELVSHMNSGH